MNFNEYLLAAKILSEIWEEMNASNTTEKEDLLTLEWIKSIVII